MKKKTKHPPHEQQSLFEQLGGDEPEDLAPDELEGEDGEPGLPPEDSSVDDDSPGSPPVRALAAEPLFSALLRKSVQQQWANDAVLIDFVDYVAAPLSDLLGHVTAKGGDFAAAKRAEAEQLGRPTERIDHYSADQSLRAHLVNGLFPVLHVGRTLQRWGAPQFRYYDDTVRRLFIAGYVLHDWLKLPQIDAELEAAGLRHDRVNAAQHAPVVAGIFLQWGYKLGLNDFLRPLGGLHSNLHELIFLASNTQVKWGTLRNLAALPDLHVPGPQLDLAEQLCRLADYLAYIGRTPRAVAGHPAIRRELAALSDQKATLVYQHIAEVRGVLTNLIQNAALAACSSDDCVPLLYAPTGVVYLARRNTFVAPGVAQIADQVVERVKQLSKRALAANLTGFNRDGKGMKHAAYYRLFFDPLEMISVGLQATLKIVHSNKPPAAGKRYDKLVTWLSVDVPRAVMDDIRVDQLAEWCYLAEKTVRDLPGGTDAPAVMLRGLGLWDLTPQFLEVPRDSRAGGVGYHWYFAAGHYLNRNPGLDPVAWEDRICTLAKLLIEHLRSYQAAPVPAAEAALDDGFGDLRTYVINSLTFGPNEFSRSNNSDTQFGAEYRRYSIANKRGKKEAMCALCSSAYAVRKQEEAASLFAPQVYSNKLALHGADALRNICTVCGLEIMLRQLLMNDNGAVGKNFEGRRLRYLYFYPTYFFTPETLGLFRNLQDTLKAVSISELRKQLVGQGEDAINLELTPSRWQRLQDFLLAERTALAGKDRFLRMHFPEREPITFFFLGVPPPGRNSKDAQAWVLPALLSLILPLCIDVKVVASETPLPFINDGDEFDETVFVDSAHAAVGYLLGQEHINLDHVLPLANRLAVAYFIHLDSNAKMVAGKCDYRWQALPQLARQLASSSLYAFYYLKKWQRASHKDAIPTGKARLYMQYQALLASTAPNLEGDQYMSHAGTLTELYRRFYRAKARASSNSTLRPITVAAQAILSADRRIYVDADGLAEIVRGEVVGFVDRVASHRADGYVPRIEVDGRKVVDEGAIKQFADYFVKVLFFDALRSDVSALRGRQLNLLKNACEVIYRDLDAQYWAERGKDQGPDQNDDELISEQVS